jgi:hypothetical protein
MGEIGWGLCDKMVKRNWSGESGMNWQSVRVANLDQWLIIEALETHTTTVH